MNVAFSSDAAAEFLGAVRWYENRRSGLGLRLRDAVGQSLRWLREHPFGGAERAGARQMPVAGFPLVIVYEISDAQIVIVAVAHTRRRPNYWRDDDQPR